jgi:hypothetical protein
MLDRRMFMAGAGAIGIAGFPAIVRANTPQPEPVDMFLLRNALQLHPGRERYLSPAGFNAAFDTLSRQWPGLDRRARFLALARFLAQLQCGHSYPNFYNQREPVQQELFADLPRVPFTFRWIASRMVVTGDAGGTSGLPPGTTVLSINGLDMDIVYAELHRYVRADGGNDGKRRALLEMRGDDGLETFDIFYGLVFGGTASDTIRITALLPDGRRVTRDLASATLASRIASAQSTPSGDGAAWQWTERPDGIARLTMDGWALYNSRWDWRGWLDERLASLPANGRLIIDIRNNEGGLDCGDHILARLAERDIVSAAYERRVRFRRTPDALNPYLDTWDDSFRTLGENAEDIGNGFFRLPAEEGAGRIAARGPRLNARVAVLTSAVNSSATFAFAQKCKETGLARLFGTMTGGNRRGINGGAFFFVRLPESGLEFDLPLIGTFPTTRQPNAGILPDQWVETSARHIAAGRDPVMEAAADWLRRG